MKNSIQLIKCKKCKCDYLVGADWKDLRNTEFSSGEFNETPYLSFGNNDINDSPKLNKIVKCHICGELCEVISSDGK